MSKKDKDLNGVMVLHCQKCDRKWVEKLDLPMEMSAAISRIRGINVCPGCGNKKGIWLLTGDKYFEALKELKYVPSRTAKSIQG